MSPVSGIIGDVSSYIFSGVHYKPLASEAESRVRVAIDAHLDLVFLVGESLFHMMLVLFNAAASLAALFGGCTSGGACSGWLVSRKTGISCSGGEVISVFAKLTDNCANGV